MPAEILVAATERRAAGVGGEHERVVREQDRAAGERGAGYAKIDNLFFTTNTANAFAATGSDKRWGYVGGGGIEQKLTKNISIGMEYTYHQYKDDDARVRVTAGTALAGSPVLLANNPFVLAPNTSGTTFRRSDENFRWHSLRGTVSFRF